MRDTDHQSACGEPRWPAALAVLTMLGLVVTLPARLQLFPPWFPYAVVIPLLAPIVVVGVSHGRAQWIAAERVLVLTVAALIAVISVATLVVVIREMLSSSIAITGLQLLASSVALWVTFIVIASLLYWQLDRGGPGRRGFGIGAEPDWRFPGDEQAEGASPPWVPAYPDYLFLAFTTATAFSPTDCVPLTARAKMLMMIQALLSLVTMVIVAARAVGELGP
jgi:hypothetical protein